MATEPIIVNTAYADIFSLMFAREKENGSSSSSSSSSMSSVQDAPVEIATPAALEV